MGLRLVTVPPPAGCYTGGTLNYWSLGGKDYYAQRADHGTSDQSTPGGCRPSAWLNNLFPRLPPPPVKPQEPKQPWPAEARAIARSLLRTEHLTGVKTACGSRSNTESFDARWNELTCRWADQRRRLARRLADRVRR